MNLNYHDQATAVLALPASRRRLVGATLLGGAAIGLRWPHPAAGQVTSPPVASGVSLRDALPDLSPPAVWQHFYDLTHIPRPSHHEEEVSAFVAGFGRDLGLETGVDDVGNVLIRKAATPGMEASRGVVLQAHLDMVPVKDESSEHDFERDPIDAMVEDGWVRANGTTLGADNGIGVAIIMAILQAGDIEHGPIEGLFTVNEEDGFTGAGAVQPGVLKGRVLLNIDSEEAGVFTTGCSGGVNIDATMDYLEQTVSAGFVGANLSISGLQGGHSGIDIDKGRGNAIKLLARLLNRLDDGDGPRLASITGGDRYNAIPRQATAALAVPGSALPLLREQVDAFAATLADELAGTEPGIYVQLVEQPAPAAVLEREAQRRIVDALNGCPDGVIRMSDAMPGLVETSTNLGTLALADGRMQARFLVRSSIDSARDAVRDSIASIFSLAGAETAFHDAYSGWPPDPDSPLLALMHEVHLDLFGTEAGVMAVHAGLETSKFAETYPEMDMLSLGPTMRDVHSPDERLDIASVGTTWELLVAALGRMT
jgi:dipeptidase D